MGHLHNRLNLSKSKHLKGKGREQKGPFFVVFYYKGVRTPPFVVPWESEFFLVNIFVVVDAIGLETDFTLETKRKGAKEKLLKRT